MPRTRDVYPGDPDYPVDRCRFSGTIDLAVEVVYDGDGDQLAKDMRVLVQRAFEDRGCVVWAASHGIRNVPHRLEAS